MNPQRPELHWTLVRSEEGPHLKLFKARFDYLRNPRNQKVERMIIIEASDSVNVVAVTPDRNIVFVEQFRFGIRENTIELPGGLIDDGEDSGIAAARELREETGYISDHWVYLGKVPSNPVFMDNYVHHWAAFNAEQKAEMDLDEGESIEPLLIPEREINQQIKSNRFGHPHTISALIRFLNLE